MVEQIALKIKEAQDRIAELKADHKEEIAKAQEIIANMRAGSQDNKGQFIKEIEIAEQKIFDSQGNIDLFIVEKQPLEKEMLTPEAEIGPVKYIAALAVDWGITEQVETSKAVRWVIIIIIFNYPTKIQIKSERFTICISNFRDLYFPKIIIKILIL